MTKEKLKHPEKNQVPDPEFIRKTFITHLENRGKRPSSLTSFCKVNHLDLATVKRHYKTLAVLEKAVWLSWFEETIAVLANSEEYKNYSAQERLLSFYYTWLETIKPFRKYIVSAPVLARLYSTVDWFLKDIQQAFLNYVNEIIQLAITNQEIVKRPVLQNLYDKALWQQFLFVMNFWIKDESEAQTKTDEAIERAVLLSFELAGPSQLDAVVDFGKFLLKSN